MLVQKVNVLHNNGYRHHVQKNLPYHSYCQRNFYGTHYANAEIDSYGVAGIVREVLTEKPAILPRNVPDDMRAHAIQVAMFSHEIIALAKPKFAIAGLRYKAQAVKNVLSTYGTHEIGKIELTKEEDTTRGDGKPRKKYYLIAKQQ